MRYLDKLQEGAAKKEKLSPKQYRNMMTAVRRVKSVEREASGSEPSDAFSRGVKKGAKGEILRQHEKKKKKALGEAKKRFYTKDEIDAYARGREKATIARRKKEFEDFKDEVVKKSKEEKKKKVEEGRTIPKQKGGGYSKKTTSPDRRVSPTEKSLEGEGLSRAEYRRRMKKKLKAEAYIQLGDTLAEGMSGKAKKVVKKLKTSAEKSYRSAEVGEASGESAESVKKKSAKAHKRMAKAQEIEGKG